MPETKYPALLRAFYSSPWAILPAKLLEVRAFLHFAAAGGKVSPEQLQALARPPQGVAMAGRVAVLPLFGLLAQRMGMVEECSGGTGTESFGQAFDQCLADKAVKAIVLAVDSPGGSVFGVAELAAKVYGARGQKKVVAVADSMAASAAYWVASQAQEFYCTPGGLVGSIGVLLAHEDHSAELEEAGVKVSLVTAGKYKAEGGPWGPLDDDARAALQDQVNAYYALFVAGVARGRGVSEAVVRNGYGQGRMLTAKDAKAAGMVDGVATLEQVLSRLGAPASPGGGPGAAGRSLDSLDRELRLEDLDAD